MIDIAAARAALARLTRAAYEGAQANRLPRSELPRFTIPPRPTDDDATLDAALTALATLLGLVPDLHWQARRYCDGRATYAVWDFNRATRHLLALGVALNATGDGTIWALAALTGEG